MRLSSIFFILLAFVLFVPEIFSQTHQQLYEADRRRQAIESQRQYEQNERRREHMENLQRMTQNDTPYAGTTTTIRLRLSREFTEPLSKTTDEERELLTVSVEDRTQFDDLLKQKGSGIARVFDVSACKLPQNEDTKSVKCPNSVWNRGTAFSFRHNEYLPGFLSDIVLRDGIVSSEGTMIFGIMGEYDNNPALTASVTSPGVDKLVEFEPSTKISEFTAQYRLIDKGVVVDGKVYKNEAKLKEGQNYLLRSVAYRADYFRVLSGLKIQGKSITGDGREDIIVVFRAVRQNPDKSWLIVWRTIVNKAAPKMKFK